MTGRHQRRNAHTQPARRPTSGRLRRWSPVAFLVLGFAVLVWLYWPVILTGLVSFVAVSRLLRARMPRSRRGRFLRETAPRWVEAVALWRAGGRIGR